MAEAYKETSVGGLAKYYQKKLEENSDIPIVSNKGEC